MTEPPEADQMSPVLPFEFAELEKLSINANQRAPEERLAHLGKRRRAYYGEDAINGKIEKVFAVVDTTTNEVIETIDFR